MSKPNILVVDDTIANLVLLEAILNDENYHVRTAVSGEDALRSIEAKVPDLILLDIMMPRMDGYEACSKIKKIPKTKEVPIIFVSAKGEPLDKIKGFDCGAVDYVTKPYDSDEIIARINAHLKAYLLQKKLEQKLEIIDKNVITSTTDINGVITDVSQAFCDISGYTKKELINKSHNILRHEDMDEKLYSELWDTIKSGKTWRGEIKNKKKDGSEYWVYSVMSPIRDSEGDVTGYSSIRQDITNKKMIEEISITDQLTGLYNRRHFNDTFNNEIKRSIRQGSILSFVMLDVDFFKQYNDNYGHQAGDKVLKDIGTTLKSCINRSEDLSFRLGGEEFGVLFSTTKTEDAQTIAELIRKAIENLSIEHKFSKASDVVTASLGLLSVDFSKKSNCAQNINSLYKIADDELYKAKKGGRNRVSVITL